MRFRQALNEVMFGLEARLKLVEITLTLRAFGYPVTGNVPEDVKAALVAKVVADG